MQSPVSFSLYLSPPPSLSFSRTSCQTGVVYIELHKSLALTASVIGTISDREVDRDREWTTEKETQKDSETKF